MMIKSFQKKIRKRESNKSNFVKVKVKIHNLKMKTNKIISQRNEI